MGYKKIFQISLTTVLMGLLFFGTDSFARKQVVNDPAKKASVFYPSAPETPRIQFLTTINGSNFVASNSRYGDRFKDWEGTIEDEEENPLRKPYGIALQHGKLFVCDKGKVNIFDLINKNFTVLGFKKGAGKLKRPINIAVDTNGTRYVADIGHKKIMIYNGANRFIKSYGGGEEFAPTDVVIFGSKLYVIDMKSSQVVVMNKETGQRLTTIATVGSGNGELFYPTNLTLDFDGNIYVSDTVNGRVSKFDNAGKFLLQYGVLGDGFGRFVRPKGLATDRNGFLYVADAASEQIQIFNNAAKLLLFFPEVGNVPGGVNLPAQVAIDYDNVGIFKKYVAPGHTIEHLILVTNQFGKNKLNVYGYLKQM